MSYRQRSLLKERHCLCKRQRSQRKALFSSQAQGHAARHQNREARACGEQLCHRGGRLQNLLEIIEDQQEVFFLQEYGYLLGNLALCGLTESKRLGEYTHQQRCLAKSSQCDEHNSIGEMLAQLT